MRRVAHWLRRFLCAIAGLGVLAYALAALVTVADILGRQIGMAVDGVVDLVQLFVMAGAWLVMPYAFMAGAHVGVDFLVKALPARPAEMLRLLAATLAFGLLALMLWQGVLTYETRTMFGDKSQQLGIPIAWYWWPLLAGLALSLLGVILAAVEPPEGRAQP